MEIKVTMLIVKLRSKIKKNPNNNNNNNKLIVINKREMDFSVGREIMIIG